ncbi:MAG: peptidoglycan-binding protein [Syntrophomonadaceae bacterium]|nr:peptidoglycan-binding protein [Syntrophomonadaceae bacterium]
MTTYITLGSRELRRGDEGTDVELLQNLLKVLPETIGSMIKEKTVFGTETEAAVKKFQRYFNLTADGVVGADTFLFLGVPTGKYLPPGANLFGERTLSNGNYGYDVWVLQNRLATTSKSFAAALGQPATRSFDSPTEAAVKLFQKDVHLNADGIVGQMTFYQLYNYAGMGARVLQKSRWDRNQGYDVYWLQKNLHAMDYYNGKLDGVFGPKTEAAVKNLQEDAGIKTDGIVGAKTFFYLAPI